MPSSKIEITLVQSQGEGGRYAKLRIRDNAGTTTIDLSHAQLGQLISGITIEAEADRRGLPTR